jgi:hypothetical protein
VTQWHRKHAIRTLNVEGSAEREGHPRARVYDDAIRQALLTLWEASDRVCGKRLRPLLPALVEALEGHGHLQLDEAVKTRVLAASAAPIDRLLAQPRAAARGRVLGRTRMSPSVRRRVPVRTFADWKEPAPGCMEADHLRELVGGSELVVGEVRVAAGDVEARHVGALARRTQGGRPPDAPFPGGAGDEGALAIETRQRHGAYVAHASNE